MRSLYAAYARWCCSTQCSPLPGILAIGLAAAGMVTKPGRQVMAAAGVVPALIVVAVLVLGGLLQILRSRRLNRTSFGTPGPAPAAGSSRRPPSGRTPAPRVSGRPAPAPQQRTPEPKSWPYAGEWTRAGERQ